MGGGGGENSLSMGKVRTIKENGFLPAVWMNVRRGMLMPDSTGRRGKLVLQGRKKERKEGTTEGKKKIPSAPADMCSRHGRTRCLAVPRGAGKKA